MTEYQQTELIFDVEPTTLSLMTDVTAPDGREYAVSTVQRAIFTNAYPYETVVFDALGFEVTATEYATPGGARTGHDHICSLIGKGRAGWEN